MRQSFVLAAKILPAKWGASLIRAAAKLTNPQSLESIFPRVYADLCRLAQRAMNGERGDHTLQATALVHEVYLRLAKEQGHAWAGKQHVLAIACSVLHRILVDHARARGRLKRGGDVGRSSLDAARELAAPGDEHLIALDEALAELAQSAPRAVQVVEMRYFAGFSAAETAEALGVTTRTVERDWDLARAWLFRRLGQDARR
jgi:RNA polymerase sigma factor (TIGR02999 family)